MLFPTSKKSSGLKEVISYTYPKLYTGKEWYIGFYAFDPVLGKMRRKRIKVNHITKVGDRRRYADGLVKRLMDKLDMGWNPFIEAENQNAYHTFSEACSHYKRYITKMFNDNVYREDTYKSYISYIKNIEDWNAKERVPATYIYQFDRGFILRMLEHVYIERNLSAQTRDNYLAFMRLFSSFLVQHQFLSSKPTEGLNVLGKRIRKKERTVISQGDIVRLNEYLMTNNKHYLLACYILHYCFIRPKEMSKIQLKHISLKNQTIIIPSENSKNAKRGVVTLPAKVIHLMVDLGVFNAPSEYFLFSDRFMPGAKIKSEKQFRDYWHHYVRKALKFPATYKFYSLKDTGITNMLRKYDSITVRDQARHATVLMTDTYTPHDLQQANDLIKNHDGLL
jgi:integrase